METSTKHTQTHMGRKIGRIRELRGMKQEALALELGISQQTISKIEQSEVVEEQTLDKIAKILGVTPQAMENFNEESVINYFNNFNDSAVNNGTVGCSNYNCTFNPVDKVVELYERLLQSEKEKVELLKNRRGD